MLKLTCTGLGSCLRSGRSEVRPTGPLVHAESLVHVDFRVHGGAVHSSCVVWDCICLKIIPGFV